MSQPEPVIWQLSSTAPRRGPATERELRQAYRTAAVHAGAERARGARERMHTLGISTAVCCGLMLNSSNIAQGVEIGVAAVKELGTLL